MYADARRLQNRGLFSQADGVCRQILAKDPQHADALHLRGTIAYRLGKPASAVEFIEKAIRFREGNVLFHIDLARALLAQDKCIEALAQCERARALAPKNPEVHFLVGNAHLARGDAKSALTHYEHALALKPNTHSPSAIWALPSTDWTGPVRRWYICGARYLCVHASPMPTSILAMHCRILADLKRRHWNTGASSRSHQNPPWPITPSLMLCRAWAT